MRVATLGSGMIDAASAQYLNQAGHEVTAVDRESEAALKASAANTGQISPRCTAPWVAPGVPLKAIKWMFQCHVLLAIHLDGTQFQSKRIWQMLCSCDISHYIENEGRVVRLAKYSRDCLKASCAEINIQYEGRQDGVPQLFRTEQQYENATRGITVLEDTSVPYQPLESSRLVEVEPALVEVAHKLTGGLQLSNDETEDCQLFTQNPTRMVEQTGVRSRFNTPVDQLLCDSKQIYGMKCGDKVIKADMYVMVFGSCSTAMFKDIVDIPVCPLKGCLLTIPITQGDSVPMSTILDETYKIIIIRFDNRIHIGEMAEAVGFNTELLQPRHGTLEMVIRDFYPRGGHVKQTTFWTGLRPMTSDGTPVVGRTHFKSLWLSTGYGTLGWTMACGPGQLLNNLLSGYTPAIPCEDLSVTRYSRGFIPLRPGHLHGAHS